MTYTAADRRRVMDADCIRRANAVWTTCNCPPCRIDRLRKAKLARHGLYRRIPNEAAWAVVDRLRERGWSGQAIASAAGVGRRAIENALTGQSRGRRVKFGPATARMIVNHGDPIEGMVGAYAATRRLQGLARQQWDLERLAAKSGIGFSTLAAIRNGTTRSIRARYHVAIRDLAAEIGVTVGPSAPARLHAIRKDWPGLFAWDDIDAPDEQPQGTATPRNGRHASHTEARIADLEHFVGADMSLDEACRELGVTADALWKWAARHDRRDLYERLARGHRRSNNQHTARGAA